MRKRIDLRVPRAQIVPTASPVAPLQRTQVQKPQESEIAKLARGFGGLVPALTDLAERAMEDEQARADAEIRGATTERLMELLESDDLKGDLGLRYGASLMAAEARVGSRLGEGFRLSPDTIIALGDPLTYDRADKEAMVDKEIQAYLNSMPPAKSPFIQAGLRESMAAVRQSALADGDRRSASRLEGIRVTEIERGAIDAVFAAGLSETHEKADYEDILSRVNKGLPEQKEAMSRGLSKGFVALAEQDHEAALARAEEARALGLIDEENMRLIKSQVLGVYNTKMQLQELGKGPARTDAKEQLTTFTLKAMTEGLTDAPDVAGVYRQLRENPEAAKRIAGIRENYQVLTEDEWNVTLMGTLQDLAANNRQFQSQLDRNNKALPEDVKESIRATRGIQSEYDKVAGKSDWTYEQQVLADSIFQRAERTYADTVNALVEDHIVDRRYLSTRDRDEIERLQNKGDTDGIVDVLSGAAKGFESLSSLWEYQQGEAFRDEFYRRGGDRLLEQYQKDLDEIGGRPGDLTPEMATAEFQRIIEERMANTPDAWPDESLGGRMKIMDSLASEPVDLIADTKIDDWMKLYAMGERNTQTDDEGKLMHKVEAPDRNSIEALTGEFLSDFPELGRNLAGLHRGHGMFTATHNPRALAKDLNSPEFRTMLETLPMSRQIVSDLLVRSGSTTVDAILADKVGTTFFPEGLPLELAVPKIEGTSVANFSALSIPELPGLLQPLIDGGEITERGQALKDKLMEASNLDEENFMRALPGIIRAQETAADRVDSGMSSRVSKMAWHWIHQGISPLSR